MCSRLYFTLLFSFLFILLYNALVYCTFIKLLYTSIWTRIGCCILLVSYLDYTMQVLNICSLRVQDLLHHPVHIRPGSLNLPRPISYVWTPLRLRVFCRSLSTPLLAHPSIIPLILIPTSQLPGWDQFQPNGPGVPVWGRWVAVGSGHKRGAAAQRAVTVPGGGRGGGGAVADGPFCAVG